LVGPTAILLLVAAVVLLALLLVAVRGGQLLALGVLLVLVILSAVRTSRLWVEYTRFGRRTVSLLRYRLAPTIPSRSYDIVSLLRPPVQRSTADSMSVPVGYVILTDE
jgi:hypothetical protein